MLIAHFDVDSFLKPYLKEKTHTESIQNANKSFLHECISIKSSSVVNYKSLLNFPKLKLIVSRTVGVNHIDLDYCKENNIAIYHIVDYGSYNIAEHALALLLSGAHNIIFCQNEVKNGIFSYKNWLGTSLKNKTVGVLGTGKIGLELIKRAKAFDANIIAYDVYRNEKASKELNFRYVSFNELIQSSDVITIHASLTPETKYIINGDAIRKMKDDVILINTSRGALINTGELIQNIKKFKFVGLDVIENEENFSSDHPLLNYENVIITPHIGFFTDDSVKRIAEETYACITNYLNKNSSGRLV